MKLLQWTYPLSRRKWWKQCWPRLRRRRRRKTSRFQSRLLRRRFNRSLSRKEPPHLNNNKPTRNSFQSRARDRCRCREQKPSRYTRHVHSTLTRLVHGTSSGVERSSAQWTQVVAASVAVVFRQALGVRSWIMPLLAHLSSGDLDLEQCPRLTFPSHSP